MEFNVDVVVKTTGKEAIDQLEQQINSLQGKSIDINISTNSARQVQNLTNQIQNLQAAKITPTINATGAVKSAAQTGQKVGTLVSQNVSKAIDNVTSKGSFAQGNRFGRFFKIDKSTEQDFQQEMTNLVQKWTNGKGNLVDLKVDTRTEYDKSSGQSMERLHQAAVTYKNDVGEIVKKTIAWRQIGATFDAKGNEVPIRGFVEVGAQYSKTLDTAMKKTDTFADRQKRAVGSLESALSTATKGYKDPNASRPVKQQENLDKLQQQEQVVRQAIDDFKNSNRSTFTDTQVKAQQELSTYKDMIKEARNAESVYNKIDEGLKTSKFDTNLKNMQSKVGSYTGSQTEEFTKAQQAVETYEKSLSAIKDHVNGINKMSGTDLKATYDDMLRAGKTFQNVKSQLQSVTAPLSNASKEDLFYDIDTGKYDAISTKFQKQISAFNGQNTENIIKARDAIKTYNEELGKVTAHRNGESIMDDESLNRSVANMQKAKDTAENMLQVITNTESKTLAPSVAATSSNRVLQYMENNSKAARKYGADLQYLAEQYRSMQTVEQKATNDKAFANLKSRISAEGLTGNSFFKETGRAFKQIGQFAGVYGVLQNTIMQLPYKVFSSVQDVNAAQIELTKVSDASQSDLTKYWDTAAESANKYGATISDVISSTADWSRLGYNLDDAKELSDATTLLQKVGDNMTQESSSEGMISTLKGFKMEASDAMSIVDKVNEVANTEPIDTSGLFAGLERSASSMNAANNSLEQTIALITAAKHYWLIVW